MLQNAITFIIGAGASVESGCPVLADFLNCARTLYYQTPPPGIIPTFQQDYEAVNKAISALTAANAKSVLDLSNLEQVMSAIDLAVLVHDDESPFYRDMTAARNAIHRLIVATLAELQHVKVRYDYNLLAGGQRPQNCSPTSCVIPVYSQLAALIAESLDNNPHLSIYIVTFNYDIGLDVALSQAGVRFSYELPQVPVEHSARVFLCKLHGSTNFFVSSADATGSDSPPDIVVEHVSKDSLSPARFADVEAQSVAPNSPLFKRYRVPYSGPLVNKWQDKSLRAYIIPPSDAKALHRHQLRACWIKAREGLARSHSIINIGYSIPPTDTFFHQFFALGMLSEIDLREVWTINPDKEVSGRMKLLLNTHLAANPQRMIAQHMKASEGLEFLAERLRKSSYLL